MIRAQEVPHSLRQTSCQANSLRPRGRLRRVPGRVFRRQQLGVKAILLNQHLLEVTLHGVGDVLCVVALSCAFVDALDQLMSLVLVLLLRCLALLRDSRGRE